MQKLFRIKLCTLLIAFLSSLIPLSSQAVEDITFSGDRPLNQYVPSVVVSILTEAFKRNGIRFKAVYHPSLRSLLYSSTGTLDGELHRVYDFHNISGHKYPNLIRIESKILTDWLAVFGTREMKFETWNDLSGYRIAYTRGRKNMQKIIEQFFPKEVIVICNNDTDAFKRLSDGQVDIVLASSRSGDYLLETHPVFKNITKLKKVSPVKIYSYIHKKHQRLAAKIANTIKEMKKDGSYASLVAAVSNSSNF
ncbi:MAG: hypothetical protein OFPI_34050 [Osedax symbiont Rs2]|nr:MAG: hypothetical protein OFPI_34050 [Osedax symbiont Rs2]